MGRMGLPVPPGFTISTKVCDLFYKDKKKLNSNLVSQIKKELKIIEKDVGKKFGNLKNPLLLSVRSGARVSMPGMMDTILNLGLNDKTVNALGDAHQVLKEKFGNNVVIKKFEKTKGWLSQKLSSSSNQVDQLANILDERSIWQRYGF